MATLFDIEDKYLQLMDEIESLDGELTPEIEEQLKINEAQLKEKITSYYYIIKTNESLQLSAKEEIDRINNYIKVKENLNKKLKSKVLEALNIFGDDTKTGGKTLTIDTLKVSTVKNIVVDVDDDNFIHAATVELKRNEDSIVEPLDESITNAFYYKLNKDITFKEVKAIMNQNPEFVEILTPTIKKTIIKDLLKLNIEVPFTKLENNPYLKFT